MFNFINEAARRLLRGRTAKPTAPQYDINDPRHPVNAMDGWRRADLPEGRRVRFRFAIGDPPKAVAPAPPTTGFGFVSGGGGGGHVESHAEPPKTIARPVPPRRRLPQTPVADSTFWTRGR